MSGESVFREAQAFPAWVWLIALLSAVVVAGLVALPLTTSVTREEIAVGYGPIYNVRIPLGQIARAEALVYRPIRDYGGWGVRGSRRHRALNARGDRGVLITRRDGTTLLVGSQRPRELLEALSAAGVTTEDRLPVVAKEF